MYILYIDVFNNVIYNYKIIEIETFLKCVSEQKKKKNLKTKTGKYEIKIQMYLNVT